ncbi:uncharacterized protein TNCV_4337631 [Trichonephila clavipes]|nr:uncharacterized protein TNCV_4337631 [Trichonephila clavipes]
MDEQLKALLEGINALKNGQEETRQEMQKGVDDTKNELKDRMEKGQEETKQEMQKCQEDLKNALEKKIDNFEEKINSVEEKIALKVEEKIAAVEEKIEKKVGEEIERIKEQVEEKIKEQVEERIEGVAESFSLISQRVEDLKKKLLVCANKNKSKILPSSPVPVSTTPVPVTASTVSVKLSTYMMEKRTGKGEAAEILQTLPDTERLNLNSLCNALDLRFSQKYSKDYAHLQIKTRLQKTGESLQEYASDVERLANLAFSDHPATVRGYSS